MKNVRFKKDGEYFMGEQMTPTEKKIHRKEYNRKWRAENPDKVQATKKRYWDYKLKMDMYEGTI